MKCQGFKADSIMNGQATGPMPGYTCVRAALPAAQAALVCPPPNLTVTGDTDDEVDEDSEED